MAKKICFAHHHMTPAEYGFWQLCRDLSHKTGTLYFDGRKMAARFAGTARNGQSKNYFYTLLKSMIRKGWFVQIEPSKRSKKTGNWLPSVHRVLSHEEWVAKKGDKHCTDASPDNGTGVESPVPTVGTASPDGTLSSPDSGNRQSRYKDSPVPLSGHNPMVNLMDQSEKENPMVQPENPAHPLSSFFQGQQQAVAQATQICPASPDSGTGAYTVPDSLVYHAEFGIWTVRRDLGRAPTPTEQEMVLRLNKERVRPQ